MGIWRASVRRDGRISWALLLALLPMLTFMGHWPSTVVIPGTDTHISIPLAGAERDSGHGGLEEHDHSQHCHGDSASCSDSPAAAGVSIALMGEGLAVAMASGLLFLAVAGSWQPGASRAVAPGRRPPRYPVSAPLVSLPRLVPGTR